MLKVAIVILNWNGAGYLKKFLPHILMHSDIPGVKVYIADNGSTDNSLEIIREDGFRKVEVIAFDKNYGFAEGYNKAFENIEAEYFLLLNSDVKVSINWLPPLIDTLDSNPLIAGCSPKIKSLDQPDFFEYAGAAGGYIDKYGYAFCRGRIFNAIETDYGQYDTKQKIFWTTGACMLVRASLFKLAGGFDPDYFAHYEEIDLCWRLMNRGYSLYSVPESTVYHVGGGGTLPKSNPRKTYLNYRNSLLTLFKNQGPEKFRIRIIMRLALDWTSVLVYLSKFQFNHAISIVNAHFSFFRQTGRYKKFRLSEKKYIKTYEHDEIYPGSIVKAYFIRKKLTVKALKWLYHDAAKR